ncbi:autotransporter outer membrane beta-barrel domain-containing protein [Marinibacterium profundimaris]|uniref:autotransporter outer membrane beta-barrel domain-containing protein n=1 Tax=Marinibacterium profundimaris TaxID=1679460 RepID=UPI00117F4C2D|nr:autotransporter outer membrane beta-barrel domain-containing protein [Marinibacterium profundimaris]
MAPVRAFPALRGSTSAVAIALAAPALLGLGPARAQSIYQCPVPSGPPGIYEGSCTLDSGTATGINLSADVPFETFYEVTNNLALTGFAPGQRYVINLDLEGPGPNFKVTNTAALTLSSNNDNISDSGNVVGLDVKSLGFTGADGGYYDDGGPGGDGGIVDVTNSAAITIEPGVDASFPTEPVFGIRARSLGGGGGAQGGAELGDQVGGAGGSGGDVQLVNSGSVSIGSSDGFYSIARNGIGLTAQSYGAQGGQRNGPGGRGGQVTLGNTADITLYFDVQTGMNGHLAGLDGRSVGGTGLPSSDNSDPGGAGADAQGVQITHSGTITLGGTITSDTMQGAGDYSAGIYALAQGGDGGQAPGKNNNGGRGGNAASNVATTITLDGSAGTSAVNVSGDTVIGLLARNLGGNGGDGQGTNSENVDGGAGGTGGNINIDLLGAASVSTNGYAAYGIVGQTIGGIGGGNAEEAGAGGTGGNVTLMADAGSSITTAGDFAGGVTFHSVGGGGGVGADFTRVLAGADGGDGGNGGNAGRAEITSGADVTTTGDHASGLLAQSVGGAGGAGGIGTSLTVSLGGDGGDGGAGGDVIVNHTGTVTTGGYGAMGVVAQTLSGGGGAAGASGGIVTVGGDAGSASNNSGTANVNLSGDITTTNDAATGVLAQSIGGGGGSAAGSAGVIAVGGSGAAGGNAGVVAIYDLDGTASTSGSHAHGISAQSIGGGGGSGGDVLDASVGLGVGIGGASSVGGNGNTVCVASSYALCGPGATDPDNAPAAGGAPAISTGGDHAVGVLAQTIGGGGGSGGSATGASVGDVIDMQIGGSASGGGNGGNVTVSYQSLSLTTAGENAHGIVAQSVGGGGGHGGDAQSVGVLDIVPVQVGGNSSAGGDAKGVDVALNGSSVATSGAHAVGIIAQSIGGGGGTGGSASGVDASAGFASDAAVGASGGPGGNGGFQDSNGNDSSTSVTLSGGTMVSTGMNPDNTPDYDDVSAFGVLVQSVGGGGGKGGSSSARAMAVALPDFEGESFAFTATASVGGAGGVGGSGWDVMATLSDGSGIVTGGDGSHGLVAQSIAHGGGAGGDASAMGGTIGDADTISATVNTAIGNSGGAGGTSRDVTVHLQDTSAITTHGDHANAIVAQSISGGGGDGGMGSTTHNQIGGGFNLTAGIGLGGTGGNGGTTGAATVTLDAGTVLSTSGSGARGIVAQAIGGGGGTGQGGTVGLTGSASVGGDGGEEEAEDDGGDGDDESDLSAGATVTVGRSPGTGSVGGNVAVSLAGTITTTGDDSDGILAQSIGGSGGLAGSVGNDAGDHDDSFGGDDEDTSYKLSAIVGGGGGQGSDGKTTTVTLSDAVIQTSGDYADGIVAQSIGGGGGGGGTSTADGSEATASIIVGVGGQGGNGGNGGAVNAYFSYDNYDKLVETTGYAAHGAVLQSIGGGGGQGGDGSEQSSGDLSVGAAVGGAGGQGGNGGTITVSASSDGGFATPDFVTYGDDAYALMAQSIGGGGGIGSAGTAESDDGDLELDIVVGGSGGAAGNGGTVNLSTGGEYFTHGHRAIGLLAQSIGGGGGVGGATSAGNIHTLTFGGQGGGAGNGGAVTLDLGDEISVGTGGNGAHAIVAQSIGGGGGIAGDVSTGNLGVSFDQASDGSDGSGGDVRIEMGDETTITTQGVFAFGVIAQSIAGGGGIAGDAEGVVMGSNRYGSAASADVTVIQGGGLRAYGSDSVGIFAQSDAPGTKGKIDIEINGVVSGATGVMVAQGNGNNVLNVNSSGSITGGTSGIAPSGSAAAAAAAAPVAPGPAVAYRGTAGMRVTNAGRISGDILRQDEITGDRVAAAPIIRLGNMKGGVLDGAKIYDAHVTNNGRMIVGQGSGMDRLKVTGDFTQGASGETVLAADFELGQSDVLEIDGKADLAGQLTVQPLAAVNGRSLSFLTAGSGVTGRFDSVSSQLFTYDHAPTADGYSLTLTGQTFADPSHGLDAQQLNVATYMGTLFEQGDTGLAAAMGALDSAAAGGSYGAALDGLSPGAALAGEAASFQLAQDRLTTLLGCADAAGAWTGGDRCLQLIGAGRWIDQTGGSDGAGYDGQAYTFGLAGDFVADNGWRFGAMAGYETSSYDGETPGNSSDGSTVFAGLSASGSLGAMTFSAAAVYGHGSYDTTRMPGLTAGADRAEASHDVNSIAGRLQASYRRDFGAAWVTPSLALDVIHVQSDGWTETGAGALSLQVSDADETALVVTPAIEAGQSFALSGGRQLRVYGRAGVSLSTVDTFQASAAFVGAGSGADPFLGGVAVPETVGRISAGMRIGGQGNLALDLRYDGAFGSGFDSHAGSLNLTMRF